MPKRINVRLGFNPAKLNDALKMTGAEAAVATDAADKVFRSYERELFASGGALGGEVWADNNPRYALWKSKQGFHNAPLVLTGKLRNSLTSPMDGEHVRQSVEQADGRWTARLGSTNPAGAINQQDHVSTLPEYLVKVFGAKTISVKARDAIQGAANQTVAYAQAIRKALIPVLLRRFAKVSGEKP
jgi:hypothetical protein